MARKVSGIQLLEAKNVGYTYGWHYDKVSAYKFRVGLCLWERCVSRCLPVLCSWLYSMFRESKTGRRTLTSKVLTGKFSTVIPVSLGRNRLLLIYSPIDLGFKAFMSRRIIIKEQS